MEIKIKCKGSSTRTLDQFQDFQGALKELSAENYEKLKNQIIELGFSEPVSIWTNENQTWILNGHQRIHTLQKMTEEGYTIPSIPVSEIEADNIQQAKKKVLALTSQFGKINEDGLREFMAEAGVEPQDIKNYRFPEINVRDFLANFTDIKGDVEFSEELLEAQNFVVLYFDNEVDWLNLQTVYPLQTVKALDSRSGYEKKGIGRVIRGTDFIKKIQGK